MIEIENCIKIFKKNNIEKKALNNINLKINNNGFVFIVGKSGSGKSTLLNLIANFDTPTSGTIKYDDVDLSSLNEKERDTYLFNEVGFVFQTYNLFEELDVKENIALGLKENSHSLKKEIEELLKEVDLKGYENKKVKNLSGGEKQRVALARALIKKPKILLCDEPCGNLDNVNSRKVLDILKSRSKDTLVLIVSHSLNDAYLYADRIITLSDGEVVSDKYINENENNDGIYVIKDLNNISNEEFDEIKNGILNKNISLIRSRKELFKDFDKEIKPNKSEKKIKKNHFLKSLFINLKLINSKIFKIGAFALITSFALGIFSSIFTLEQFDPKEFNKKAIINNSNDIISYNKSYIDGESINARYLEKVTEEDKEFLKENYKGKFYERRTFSIHTKDTAYQYSNNMTTNVFNFNSFYSNELEGLNIVDESFLKDILDIDEINILNETGYSSGVYITDYFADSMMFHNGYKNYEDFLSVYHEKGIDDNHNYARIKGIIKTNYKEKLKPLLDEINKGAKAIDLLSKEENYKYYDYLKLGLNSAFTFNPNFEINGDVNSVYTHWIDSSLGTIAYNNFKPLNFNKKNTMLLSGGFILFAYPLLKKEEVQKILDTTEFEICFRTNPSNENEIPYFKTKIKIDMKENYTNEIKDQKITGFANLLSEDLFKIFKEQSFFTIGFLFKDKSIYDLNNSLSDRKI